ncbi:MAG: S8 family serine peptidase, partial [Deinococcota bacterium]|nr:S8 family serine peptidase [Deinococcota bacterium]
MDHLRSLRHQVRNRYGPDFEQKASDELVVHLTTRGIIPSMLRRVMPAMADGAAFEGIGMESFAEASRMMPTVMEFEDNIQADKGAGPQTREEAIESFKRGFLEKSSGVTGHLQNQTGGAGGPPNTCWLNSTLHIDARPRMLAEVAQDPSVEAIDVPRPLALELQHAARTTGVTAWRETNGFGGKDVTIAIIDAEVDITHPAFGNRATQAKNFTPEAWGVPHSHGIMVAAIAAGGNKYYGIAPDAKILNYKIFPADTFFPQPMDGDGVLAIQQALEDGAHIANCSWGAGPIGSKESREARACNNAWNLGMFIVKSAGNSGANTLTVPAEARGVLVVGACDSGGTQIASYSSYGKVGRRKHRPDLVAPGGTNGSPLNVLGYTDRGTSFAAPHVSGIAALLIERDPALAYNPDALRRALLRL